jgi:hypothetical protein
MPAPAASAGKTARNGMPDINVVFVTPAKEGAKKCLKHRHSGAWAQPASPEPRNTGR